MSLTLSRLLQNLIDNYIHNRLNLISLEVRQKDSVTISLPLSDFLFCDMFNIREQKRTGKITMCYIKLALFKTARRTLIIIKVPD